LPLSGALAAIFSLELLINREIRIMNINTSKHGFIAGTTVCAALLLNDLVLFGNLHLDTSSITMLLAIGVACLVGVFTTEKNIKGNCIAVAATCIGLVLNGLGLGYLNLNTISIIVISLIGLGSLSGYVVVARKVLVT
jgi:hypothetical protein